MCLEREMVLGMEMVLEEDMVPRTVMVFERVGVGKGGSK